MIAYDTNSGNLMATETSNHFEAAFFKTADKLK